MACSPAYGASVGDAGFLLHRGCLPSRTFSLMLVLTNFFDKNIFCSVFLLEVWYSSYKGTGRPIGYSVSSMWYNFPFSLRLVFGVIFRLLVF